jgi:hypothetical protein
MAVPDFTRINWEADGFTLGGWQFKEYPVGRYGLPSGEDDCFWILKPRSMIDDYADMFARRPHLSVSRALELGMCDGGSVAFWSLIAEPDRLSALDIDERGDSKYFRAFAAERPNVKTAWKTNQADESAIVALLRENDSNELDFVIDDASHFYKQSRRSFEVVFPRIKPGGIYCLEDWQWSFESQFQEKGAPLATQRALVDLVHELLAVMASRPDLITKLEVYPLIVLIERGPAAISGTLELDKVMNRRARPTLSARRDQVASKARGGKSRLQTMVQARRH